jgi:hypothetical protein
MARLYLGARSSSAFIFAYIAYLAAPPRAFLGHLSIYGGARCEIEPDKSDLAKHASSQR